MLKRLGIPAWALGLSAVAVAAVLILHPACPIYQLFHVQCPGCGSTRALAALLHGRPLEALRWNALILLLPPMMLLYRRPVAIYPALAVVVLFTVARNL